MDKNNKRPPIREFDSGWEEFFKDKPKPKNEKEEEKQLEEFHYWYNNIRKQSDTGKTPNQMYKEIYGKNPPDNPKEPSEIMNLEFDETSEEDYNDFDKAREEAENVAIEIFEEDIWKNAKVELKEYNKKNAYKSMFILGFLTYMKLMDEEMKNFAKKAKETPKEFDKTMKKFNEILDEE